MNSKATSESYSSNHDRMERPPSSPHSSTSTTNSSLPENFEKLQALQSQLDKNYAQMSANKKRMDEISQLDEERGALLSRRLAEISHVNKQLESLRGIFSRAEKASRGDYHAGLSECT